MMNKKALFDYTESQTYYTDELISKLYTFIIENECVEILTSFQTFTHIGSMLENVQTHEPGSFMWRGFKFTALEKEEYEKLIILK